MLRAPPGARRRECVNSKLRMSIRKERPHTGHTYNGQPPRGARHSPECGCAAFAQSSFTSIPMFLAVPATVFIADCTLLVLRSGSLIFAISSTCSLVMVPTRTPPRPKGVPLPLATPAAFFSSSEVGGVLRMNEKLRSSYTLISTGTIVPALSAVLALYSLQNIMMLTPAAPSAGPMGGAGLALPAGMASLIIFVTFLAIISGVPCRLVRPTADRERPAFPETTRHEPGACAQQHSSSTSASRRAGLSSANGMPSELRERRGEFSQ